MYKKKTVEAGASLYFPYRFDVFIKPYVRSRAPILLLLAITMASASAAGQSFSDIGRALSDASSFQQIPDGSNPFARQRTKEEVLERRFAVNFLDDQKSIWTSPLHLKKRDLFWLAPSAALLGESLHRDAYLYRALTPVVNPGTTSKTFSDVGVIAMAGGVAGMYFLGRIHDNDHKRETAVLATEALANSMTVGYALKYALNRERPFNGNGNGDFFVPGGGGSFPSSHALAAWSMASVIAHEYPGPLTKIGVYGLATAISLARVTGRQHFPSDVLVGGALGWGIGTLVYRKHHDPELPGKYLSAAPAGPPTPGEYLPSTYVPLDSWVYPVLDRLSSLGYIDSSFSGQRPWTRSECARLLAEAQTALQGFPGDQDAQRMMTDLAGYLQDSRERTGKSYIMPEVEELYARVTDISGPPLTDAYHFGQTLYNDFGRPFQSGVNSVEGVSSSAVYGRWSFYLRGELQHAPEGAPLSLAAVNEISRVDSIPVPSASAAKSITRLRFLDTYGSYSFAKGWAIIIGKQSLWWGPGFTGPLSFTDDAEPIGMIRVSRQTPMVLPSFLHYLGPIRGEYFVGQLAGQIYTRTVRGTFGPDLPRQPLIEGLKASFKPTPNFEFGVSVTTLFGGSGAVLNPRSYLRTFGLSNTDPGQATDPGDRRAGFDFRYRVPFLRRWLTVYNDSFTEDEISPIGYPRRSAMNPGLYLARVPGLEHLELRAEGFYTDLPGLRPTGSYYFNERFLNGYTNRGFLIGNVVGRQGSGFATKATYWISGMRSIEIGQRSSQASKEFIQDGGSLRDYWISADWNRGTLGFSGKMQYERWNFPILASGEQRNLTTSFQVTYRPGQH